VRGRDLAEPVFAPDLIANFPAGERILVNYKKSPAVQQGRGDGLARRDLQPGGRLKPATGGNLVSGWSHRIPNPNLSRSPMCRRL
jgi:hypothetical protein